MQRRSHVIISGLVQGVAFRHHTCQEATRLGVTGWVRNLPTGAVEACCEGEADAVAALLTWCHTGPPQARVDQVTITDTPYMGEFISFIIRY